MNPRASAPLPYCASKFALVGLSEGLRAELARDGILITTVSPGLMRTGSPRNAVFKGRHRAEYAWFSISAALPVLSMSAEWAARRILAACARGEAEVVLSWPARLAAGVDVAFSSLRPTPAASSPPPSAPARAACPSRGTSSWRS